MCEGRALPDAVIDAALQHPVMAIRGHLARNQHVDPARLAPLATDPSGIILAPEVFADVVADLLLTT
ncbi:hypothetical protein UK14_22015 [Streptomyces sp. NRRL F-4428]|nr:hypothetical protein UK14_22015 [Streptomyces sp. NRRL F-4428]